MGGLQLGLERIKRFIPAGSDDQVAAKRCMISGKFAANPGGRASDKSKIRHDEVSFGRWGVLISNKNGGVQQMCKPPIL